MNGPPLCNTGGKSPPSVLVDWVSASFPVAMIDDAFRRRFYRCLDGTVGPFQARKAGLHGYRRSSVAEGVDGLLMAWEGNADTWFLQLSGDACARVYDWTHLAELFAEYQAKLTRVDLAFDDFEGEHDLTLAVDLYVGGAFTMNGRPPICSQAGNWITPDGRGRTLYVGKAANGKMIRVYEKGKQLGAPADPWVRWEVQYTNRDRVLPYSMLSDPVPYLVGSYPALGFVADGIATRIPTRRAIERISVQHLIRHGRSAYGALVNHLRETGNTESEVVETLHKAGLPRRLNAPTYEEICDRANHLAHLATIDDQAGAPGCDSLEPHHEVMQ